MSSVQCVSEQLGTRSLVRLTGDLCLTTAPLVRAALVKSLVERPDALVADLTGLVVREPSALSVFSLVIRQAAIWPGTPLLITAPDPEVRRRLSGGSYGRLEVFGSVAEALAAPAEQRIPYLSEALLPVRGAVRRARELAVDACGRWELGDRADAARLIAGELVTNAVEHAQTMVDLRFSLGRRYLVIAVRDGSTVPPQLDRSAPSDLTTGRGLHLVDALAHRWGTLLTVDGKVVWASLPVR
jgi:hypothetical protein